MTQTEKLLYEAIRELGYVESCEDHSLCASGVGKEIIDRGMRLLGVKELYEDDLEDELRREKPLGPARPRF